MYLLLQFHYIETSFPGDCGGSVWLQNLDLVIPEYYWVIRSAQKTQHEKQKHWSFHKVRVESVNIVIINKSSESVFKQKSSLSSKIVKQYSYFLPNKIFRFLAVDHKLCDTVLHGITVKWISLCFQLFVRQNKTFEDVWQRFFLIFVKVKVKHISPEKYPTAASVPQFPSPAETDFTIALEARLRRPKTLHSVTSL